MLLFGTFIRTLVAVKLFEGSALVSLVWALTSPTCQLSLRLSLCPLLFLCCRWSPWSFKLKPWNTDPETMVAFLTSLLFSFQTWTFTWEPAMVFLYKTHFYSLVQDGVIELTIRSSHPGSLMRRAPANVVEVSRPSLRRRFHLN